MHPIVCIIHQAVNMVHTYTVQCTHCLLCIVHSSWRGVPLTVEWIPGMRTLGLLLITDVIGVIVANIILFVVFPWDLKVGTKTTSGKMPCLACGRSCSVELDESQKNDNESDGKDELVFLCWLFIMDYFDFEKMGWLVDDFLGWYGICYRLFFLFLKKRWVG